MKQAQLLDELARAIDAPRREYRLENIKRAFAAYTDSGYEPCPRCAKNIAKWFEKGRNSVKRKNKSGCCCIIDDNDIVVSACGAHADWLNDNIKAPWWKRVLMKTKGVKP